MITIGIHGWMPGLAGNYMSADPNHTWVEQLSTYFLANEIKLVWLGNTHVSDSLQQFNEELPDELDGVIMYWRWRLPEYPQYAERNKAFHRQWDILVQCKTKGIAVAVFDGDYMIKPSELEFLEDYGVKLYAPAFKPKPGYYRLLYPFFSGDYQYNVSPKRHVLVYIGNNYDRYDVAKKYLGFSSKISPEIKIYGNWLEPSSGDRPSPEQVLKDFPKARFMGRLDQRNVIDVLSQSAMTIHLAKPEYMKTGFIALRWGEAIQAGIPAMIPEEYQLPKHVLGEVRILRDVSAAMIERRSRAFYWALAYAKQKEFLEIYADPNEWIKLAHRLADQRIHKY